MNTQRHMVIKEVVRRIRESRQYEHRDKQKRRKHPFLHEELEGIGPEKRWETQMSGEPEITELESEIWSP